MTNYVKWVRNSNPNSGVSQITFEDGTTLRQGVPVKLTADERHRYESFGLVFEDSSAAESKEFTKTSEEQPVGRDVAGTAPLFRRPTQEK